MTSIAPASLAPPSRANPVGTKRADVLLVDDDRFVLRAVERILKSCGYTVERAENGEAGAKAAMSGHYDVVVSDIHMPGITGTEMLGLLNSAGCDIPVIFMTGSPTLETARDAIGLGAVQYLTKPIDREALLQAVRRARQVPRKTRESRAETARDASFDRALASLWMAFQPIVSLEAHGPIAYEALMRSNEDGFRGPGQMLEYAEVSHRLPELGRRVRTLCAEAIDKLPANASLFVNLHAQDLCDEHLFSPESPLSKHAHRVVLEITERGALEGMKDIAERMARLRALGYRLAIDDLGAGYAGLTSVAVLEPDYVKLDMSLTRDLASSPLRRRLVASMIDACRDVGMLLVAEGVETELELAALQELGCDLLQGYHFAKPSPEFVKIAA